MTRIIILYTKKPACGGSRFDNMNLQTRRVGRLTFLLCVTASLCVLCSALGEAPWALPDRAAQDIPVGSIADTIDENAGRVLLSVSQSFQHFLKQRFRTITEGNLQTLQYAYESQCLDDFATLFSTTGDNAFGASLGYQAIDALGKPDSNIFGGNLYMYGSFDECFDIGEDLVQYCLAPLNIGSRYVPDITLLPPPGFRFGMCIPQSCNESDLEYFVSEANQELHIVEPNYNITAYYDFVECTRSKDIPYNTGAIAMILICAIFLLLSVIGSTVDEGVKWINKLFSRSKFYITRRQSSSINTNPEDNSENSPLLGHVQIDGNSGNFDMFSEFKKPLEFITAFSLFKNIPMILSTKQPPTAITSLNGIRVISMFWVILCHTHLWAFTAGLIKNPLYVFGNVVQRFSFQVITNGFFVVDSFFFLSGTLVAYLTLREMEKRKGRFPYLTYYLHRYLRLTMVYAFLLFFWWSLTMHFGDGHLWLAGVGEKSAVYQNCNKYWWTNLLYINNFYPWELGNECMGWTWYLANDMQFYIVAPVVLIPLYYFFPVGLAISIGMLGVSFIATGSIAGVHKYSANTFQQTPNATAETHQSDDIYIKSYCRIAPYLVGLVLGYILYKKIKFNIHWLVDWATYLGVWVLAAGCCISTVYGLYGSWHGHTFSLAENVIYFIFSRFVWAVGLALMMFACHNGYGWIVNDFLSMKVWIPLSRLTYTAYLVHPIVLTVIFTSTRDTFTYTDYTLAVYAVAMVVLSFGAAGVVAVFVEFPLSNLEMAVFKAIGLKLRESTRRVNVTDRDPALEPSHNTPIAPALESSLSKLPVVSNSAGIDTVKSND